LQHAVEIDRDQVEALYRCLGSCQDGRRAVQAVSGAIQQPRRDVAKIELVEDHARFALQ
jgi:hypothetical protein